jgi:hypothetical protein
MSGPERRFTLSVNKHLPADLHHEGMANPYRGGTPDHWYSGRKRDLWVEFKFVELPKLPTTYINLVDGKKPSISMLQQDWIRQRILEGRNVWLIAGCKTGGVIWQDMSFMVPLSQDEFLGRVFTRQSVASQIAKFCQGP